MMTEDSAETEADQGADTSSPSIFEAFEPPPEVDTSRFVPIVSTDDAPADAPEGSGDGSGAVEGGAAVEGAAEETASAPADESAPSDLPHWTEPATGQVPRVIASEKEKERSDGDGDTWQDLSGPRWKGEGPDWAEDDLADVFGDPIAPTSGAMVATEEDEAEANEDDLADLLGPATGTPPRANRPPVEMTEPSERNIPQAILFGTIMAAVALAIFYFGGTLWVLGLVTVVAALASIELFDAMRRAGLHPATLLGITAVAAFPLAAYSRGDQAYPLFVALLVVFGALWYIVGADTHRPVLNLGLTFLGVFWVGGLAAFASLILALTDGTSMLVHAIVITVAADTGALAGGRAFGSRPLHPMSPNKTWEGAIVGFVSAVVAGVVMGLFEIGPFSADLQHALYLGMVGGVLAPLGDLTESMIKRDLGVKDMGQLLPGHGGVMDRMDGLLFVLPGTYYLALVLGLV